MKPVNHDHPDFWNDITSHPEFCSSIHDVSFAQEVYNALANNEFVHTAGSETWSVSWRRGGELVADARNAAGYMGEDYLDYYCCGGNEGFISERVQRILEERGWSAVSQTPQHELTDSVAALLTSLDKFDTLQ
jgi:hypothetical protein